MNNDKKKQENTKSNKVMFVSMFALLLLLLIFFFVSLYSTQKLSSQIGLITKHPFTVSGNVSDVKTELALMRIRTERLQSYNQPEDVEKVRSALQDIYGPDEDVAALRSTLAAIQKEHASLLEFAALSSSTIEKIAAYEETHLNPLYDQFEKNAQTILSFVRNTQQSIFNSADLLSRSTLVWSVVIVCAMVLGLFVYQYAIRKMNRKLYEKNQQLEILSNTIDETFLIFEKDQIQCDFVSGSAERLLGLPIDEYKKTGSFLFNIWSKIRLHKSNKSCTRDKRPLGRLPFSITCRTAWKIIGCKPVFI